MLVVVAISGKDTLNLVKQKRICNCSCLDILEAHTIEVVKDKLNKTTGYNSNPIVSMSKIDGEVVNVKEHLEELTDYLSIASGEVILLYDVPEDEVVSVEYGDLLEYEQELDKCSDYYDFIDEELDEKLTLGSSEDNENQMSFFSCLRLKNCKGYAILSKEWKTVKKSLGDLPEIDLGRLSAF